MKRKTFHIVSFRNLFHVLRKLKNCVRERNCQKITKYVDLSIFLFRVRHVRTYAICQGLFTGGRIIS